MVLVVIIIKHSCKCWIVTCNHKLNGYIIQDAPKQVPNYVLLLATTLMLA